MRELPGNAENALTQQKLSDDINYAVVTFFYTVLTVLKLLFKTGLEHFSKQNRITNFNQKTHYMQKKVKLFL